MGTMRIGIDISQIAFEGTGVATYVRNIVTAIIRKYPAHSYVLFGASFRKRAVFAEFMRSLTATSNVLLVAVPVPPTLLEILWNRLGIFPVEWLTGPLDVFWSSDWTQPTTKAPSVTTIHDLSILKFRKESHDTTSFDVARGTVSPNIVAVHLRRLRRATKLCRAFFCDSEATKTDAQSLLGIPKERLFVVHPGREEYA